MISHKIDPHLTTIWPLSDRINVERTVERLHEKLTIHGCLSEREQAYFNRHNRIMFGKIRQKEPV